VFFLDIPFYRTHCVVMPAGSKARATRHVWTGDSFQQLPDFERKTSPRYGSSTSQSDVPLRR